MIFKETKLKDAYIIDLDDKKDERGFFARTFCEKEFKEAGQPFRAVQANLSYNKSRFTLRGMHYQVSPHEEAKIVRCIRGAVYDVIIDLRKKSPTADQWMGVELSAENRKSLYVPKGFAHGFLTLREHTEVHYLMSEFYMPGVGRGIRWDDPFYNIEWPNEAGIISEKDQNWPYRN
jgi:dTDP-4-dehydrorhamnose 3,5-epimerase